MDKRVKKIIENYDLYRKVKSELKYIADRVIQLRGNKNQGNGLKAISTLNHTICDDDITLELRACKDCQKKSEFKIFSKSITKVPLYRYDGDGPRHTNDRDDIPLNERKVKTPHFHYYDKDGVLIAYKTEKLKNKKECEAILEDREFAFSHFCYETQIKSPEGILPQITDGSGGAYFPGLVNNEDNPVAGLEFL